MKEWKPIEFGGLEIRESSGSEWRETRVIQGGNGLWSSYVTQYRVKLTRKGKTSKNPTLIKLASIP